MEDPLNSKRKIIGFEKMTSRIIQIIIDNDLSFSQILFLQILFLENHTFLYALFNTNQKLTVKEINELYPEYIENKWIKKESDYPDLVTLSEQGQELIAFLIDNTPQEINDAKKEVREIKRRQNQTIELFSQELFNTYPTHIDSDGRRFVLQVCNEVTYNGKPYKGRFELSKLYCELINYDLKTHNSIITKIKHDKTEGYVHCNKAITKFILDKTWELMPEKNNNSNGYLL